MKSPNVDKPLYLLYSIRFCHTYCYYSMSLPTMFVISPKTCSSCTKL